MKLCFTTLGCPDWSWAKIVDECKRMGYDGIEVRGVEGRMHLPKATPFLPENMAATKAELAERGISISCLGSSSKFHVQPQENIATAKEHIDLAAKLGVPFVRVFGDRLDPAKREETIAQIAGALQELGDYAAGTGVKVLLETHGDLSLTDNYLAVMERVSSPNVGVLWDVHHPFRFHGEPVAETYRRLRGRIDHIHLKDSVVKDGNIRYCLQGRGDLPLAEVISLLKGDGYAGWISLEWEKKWHPEIEEPEVAFPAFVQTLRALGA